METDPSSKRSSWLVILLLASTLLLVAGCRSANQQLAHERWVAQQNAPDSAASTAPLKVEPAVAPAASPAGQPADESPEELAFNENESGTERPDPSILEPGLTPATRAVNPLVAPATVHSAPDPTYTQLAILNAGETIRLTGRRELTSSGMWHEIELPDLDYNGWLLGRAIVTTDDPILDRLIVEESTVDASGGDL